LHLPGEHRPAFAFVKPVNSGDEVRGPYLKVVVLIGRGNVRGQVRPRTAVLTRGFDPSLSLGSARPA
jgi:hypothetical protein